jgi:hypothetical protein
MEQLALHGWLQYCQICACVFALRMKIASWVGDQLPALNLLVTFHSPSRMVGMVSTADTLTLEALFKICVCNAMLFELLDAINIVVWTEPADGIAVPPAILDGPYHRH